MRTRKRSNKKPLIGLGSDPVATAVTFVGTVILMFGVGAALTGFILMMEEAEF